MGNLLIIVSSFMFPKSTELMTQIKLTGVSLRRRIVTSPTLVWMDSSSANTSAAVNSSNKMTEHFRFKEHNLCYLDGETLVILLQTQFTSNGLWVQIWATTKFLYPPPPQQNQILWFLETDVQSIGEVWYVILSFYVWVWHSYLYRKLIIYVGCSPTVWGRALSWMKTNPEVNMPILWFWIVLFKFFSVSQ